MKKIINPYDKDLNICQLYDGQSKLCAEAAAEYFLYCPEIAKKRFRYPGREAFYETL